MHRLTNLILRLKASSPVMWVGQHKLALVGMSLGALLFAQISILAINALLPNHPVLGLRLQHQSVSLLSDADLKKVVNHIVELQESQPLKVTADTVEERVTSRQLGVRYDPNQVVKRAQEAGRQGSFIQRLVDQDAAFLGQRNISVGFDAIDPSLADAYFQNLSKKVNRIPVSAHFSYKDDKVVVVAAMAGRQLDIERAKSALRQVESHNDHPSIMQVPINYTPATLSANDLQPLLPEIQKIASQPLTLKAGNSQTTLTPAELTDILIPVKQKDPTNPQQTKTTLSFDDAKLSASIDKVAGPATQNPKPTITSGKKVLVQGTDGTHVDGTHAKVQVVSDLMKRQQATATPPAAPSAAPTTPAPQEVTTIPVEDVPAPTVSLSSNGPADKYPAQIGDKKMVYLTFDDGPGGYTEQVLDTLKKYNVHAIFFLVGRNATIYPQTVQRIKAEGHTIGNHSYTHAELTKLSDAGIADEISHTQSVLGGLTGRPLLFRPPYGAINPQVAKAVSNANLQLMLWSIDPRDWSKPGQAEITKRVLAPLAPGSNILLHSIHQQTAEALPAIIEGIRARGFTLN